MTLTLITTNEIAEMFEVNRRQVQRRKAVHTGFPKAVSREGNSQLYARKEVEEWGVLTNRWDAVAGRPSDAWRRCPCCDKRNGK